ncbi:tRNA (guanine-N(7)-)-methyltransferase [Gregarina niphandrodes]|uniref:tRNA (guanine-N(7)-)-methyltransferase n=1 Tax=Gregarina niphandrodes TaxID=110365 RepID=A0A023B6S7_GRENI|nr:tRNA (guanine-N(7)-)-methyltransferase [Gregarina niphandrodes]EZG66720.1 tRNA (guanine-N(7)-)-methyltransferase [Gregarina niphandrodes]|eukprot:XP_011130514.1 tRNA (guanine-N(7)-)-methyltransferase [Gregarina niphandrodes]
MCEHVCAGVSHCNPLSDAYIGYPLSPDHVDWSVHYPFYFTGERGKAPLPNSEKEPVVYDPDVRPCQSFTVDFIDIGCGFGGMCYELARQYPDKIILGMEIRDKVATFVSKKIHAYRQQQVGQNSVDGQYSTYENCAVLRTNAMKFLSNYLRKGSLEKAFFLFPDPQFKRNKWRRRIVTPQLLSLYAYHLKETEGRLYFVTDVHDLFVWIEHSCQKHPLFKRIPEEQCLDDPAYTAMFNTTDECKKAIRLNQKLFGACYQRLPNTRSLLTPNNS